MPAEASSPPEKLTATTAASLIQRLISTHSSAIAPQNFDKRFYDSLRVRAATVAVPAENIPATVVFECTIPATYTNQTASTEKKTTHGGAIAMFFDMTTSMAIVACDWEAWRSTGASRKLDVTYLKPPVEGERVLFECEVIQIGKRLAELRGVIRREADGALLATCEHQKYMAETPHYVPKTAKL